MRTATAIIPARGGSKGVINKNIRLLKGKPLIQWTIEVALASKLFKQIIVSTDDPKIMDVCRPFEVVIDPRPEELARDDSLVYETINHILGHVQATDLVYLLEPTSPLRNQYDLQASLELFDNDTDCVASFTQSEVNAHRIWKVERSVPRVFIEGANPFLRRQDLPDCYRLNGAIYAFRRSTYNMKDLIYGNVKAYLMPRERSIDIDDEIDLLIADHLLGEVI